MALAFPRWRLTPLLGGPDIYSRRSLTFGPGKVMAVLLLAAVGSCASLLRNPRRPAARTVSALVALAGAFAASVVLASIPKEAVGYSLAPTPAVRVSQFAIGMAVVALLVPYGTLFHHRILSPEEREGSPHPARESLPSGVELEEEEPG